MLRARTTDPGRRNPASGHRVITRTGNNYGMRFTSRDQAVFTWLARWYAGTATQLARTELDPDTWAPWGTGLDPAQNDQTAVKLRNRYAKASKIRPERGAGPWCGNELTNDYGVAWWVTPYGGRLAGVPWAKLRDTLYIPRTGHGIASADVGQQLEAWVTNRDDCAGLRVLSQRELQAGYDYTGTNLPRGPLITMWDGMEHIPDLAVTRDDGESYVAIEVERDTNRAIGTYRKKLVAYARNPRIRHVWYLCRNQTVENRVARAYEDVAADHPTVAKTVLLTTPEQWEPRPGGRYMTGNPRFVAHLPLHLLPDLTGHLTGLTHPTGTHQ